MNKDRLKDKSELIGLLMTRITLSMESETLYNNDENSRYQVEGERKLQDELAYLLRKVVLVYCSEREG